MIKAILEILANITGMLRKRQDVKNTSDVKAAEVQQDKVNKRNELEKDIVQRDADAMRRGWSE
jgi:hypothetical protein